MRAAVLAFMTSVSSIAAPSAVYGDDLTHKPHKGIADTFNTEASATIPECRVDPLKNDYIQRLATNYNTSQNFSALIGSLANSIFPTAFTGNDVTADNPDSVRSMQQMLMRLGCYSTDERSDDGVLGNKTQIAIASFVESYGEQYHDLTNSIIYTESDEGQENPFNITGVSSRILSALAYESAKDITYKAELFRAANTGENGFNRHSFELAVFKDIQGANLGQAVPDYAPLLFDERDIDMAARTVYGEARDQDNDGQIAVVYNFIHRALSHHIDELSTPVWFKDNIADNALYPQQYSAWNEEDPNREKMEALDINGTGEENARFRKITDLVMQVFYGDIPDPTNGADHYHTASISADWSEGESPVASIGDHEFYDLYSQVPVMRELTQEVLPELDKVSDLYNIALSTGERSLIMTGMNMR